MKRTLVLSSIVVVAVVAVAGRALVAQQQPAGPKVAAIEKVKDNLYMVTGGGGNTAVFVMANGVAVVDTKNPGWGQPILDKIKELTPKPVTLIINTHTHGDHVSGNVEFPATVDVVTVPWTRNERGAVAGLKTTSYAENVRALAYAQERGGGEAIFLNTRGELCEATGSNVFVVHESVVRTPPGRAGCLLGVTRALVLELCAEHGVPAEEAVLAPAALGEADEAFVTSSTREVQPIARVDGRALPAAPGPTTEKIAGLFGELTARDPDP